MDQFVVMAGVGATFIWFLISLLFKKNSIQKTLISSAIFATWYILAGLAYSFINRMAMNFSLNKYSVGLITAVMWFLLVLVVQKKSVEKSLHSTGLYVLFYVLAELIYTAITNLHL